MLPPLVIGSDHGIADGLRSLPTIVRCASSFFHLVLVERHSMMA
jgi:hypothetical protein